ncbi:type II toxin-antitoxin system ParD family antitoxin [Asticcacaulis sp. DW145]|uniref:Type II toxin-antitoxin system ParD family antitoxin n=2 Tax=Asticcacaulis TaxID=76890 RepID=A0ABT5ID69_9CAUL|nr:type II toxin-antitoxin system ParD family antitoxin [Asticcacaulis currens]MDC7694126.1 type II toxin-antitoxin system ParD family antitoxin [Asticcacaulis currens]BEV09916.1 type II toxin-antitoxin system ParD family antitoxin [Asticcacaulis sp. DW145]
MSVSLSETMRGFIKSRVSSGDYHNESEYIRDLVRRDQERLNQELRLAKLLEEAEQSGLSDKSLPDIMQAVKQKLKADGRL